MRGKVYVLKRGLKQRYLGALFPAWDTADYEDKDGSIRRVSPEGSKKRRVSPFRVTRRGVPPGAGGDDPTGAA